MENEILEEIKKQDKKLTALIQSMEQIRKYFLWTFVITIATIILPLIILIFTIPWFLRTMTSAFSL